MKQLLLWAGVFVLALQPVMAQTADKAAKEKSKKEGGSVAEQIEKLSDEGREAALKGDVSFLENNTADDYTAIGGMGNVMSKSDAIQMRKSGDVKYSAIDVSDKKVRVYGDTAVLTATADLKGTVKDKDISGKYRIGQVWVKQGGKWKMAHMQSTKVQEGS
jgi:hypothetical protein